MVEKKATNFFRENEEKVLIYRWFRCYNTNTEVDTDGFGTILNVEKSECPETTDSNRNNFGSNLPNVTKPVDP